MQGSDWRWRSASLWGLSAAGGSATRRRVAAQPVSAPTAYRGCSAAVTAALTDALDAVSVLVAGFLGFAAVFAWFKAREASHDQDFSVTGVFAGLGVFLLGALAVAGDIYAAAAGGAALAAVLASREVLHGLLRRLTWIELRSAMILAVMTAIVLPLLPNRTIDPWGGLNPWEVWFFTVLIAAISYFGYVAVRVFGATQGLIVERVSGCADFLHRRDHRFGSRGKTGASCGIRWPAPPPSRRWSRSCGSALSWQSCRSRY